MDDKNMSVYVGGMTAGTLMRQEINNTLNYSFDQTDIDVTIYTDPDDYNLSSGDMTDQAYFPAPLDAGTYGASGCQNRVSGSKRCNRANTLLDVNQFCSDYYADSGRTCAQDPLALRFLACHETGHNVGLVHGNSVYPPVDRKNAILGCMADGQTNAEYPWYVALGKHQVSQIDGAY